MTTTGSDQSQVPRTTREVARFVGQPAVSTLITQLTEIGRAFKPFVELASKLNSSFKKFALEVVPVVATLGDALHRLPARTRESLLSMAERGWYMDDRMEWAQMIAIAGAIDDGEFDHVEEELCRYYDSRIDHVRREVAVLFPARQAVIAEALDAIREGRYHCSIPVLLIQAEGMCRDVLGQSPYEKRSGSMKIAAQLEGHQSDQLMQAFLAPLVQQTPLSRNSIPTAETDILNRHAVVHGLSTSYGTRLNGFRAISLLVYLLWVLDDVRRAKLGLPQRAEE